MPLEAATYIDGLNSSNPAATDQLQQSDDHLRLIKSVLKATFPNITGPVTATQASINSPASSVPVGLIALWYGSNLTVPATYAICDGTLANKSDGSGTIQTPDLRSRIPMGAGTTVAQGALAGALTDTITTSSDGAHTHTVDAHTHTTPAATSGSTSAGVVTATSVTTYDVNAQNPGAAVQSVTQTDPAHTHTIPAGVTGSGGASTSSSGGAHTHTATVDTLPPVLGLHYIMKV